MNRKVTVTGVNIMFSIFTVVFIAYQLVISFLFGDAIYDNMYIMLLINEFVMIMGAVVIYCLIVKPDIKQTFKLNKPGLVPMLLIAAISVPAYLAAAMLNNIILYFLQFIGNIPNSSIPVPKSISELIIGILVVGVSPGICEEAMHRGLMLKAYERRGSYRAIVITAIFFGIFHLDITNLVGPIFLGLIIGYYVVRTNSIFAGMFAHFLNNTIAEVLQYIYRDEPSTKYLSVTGQDLLQLILLGLAGLAVTAALIELFRRCTQSRARLTQPISTPGDDAKAVLSHWPVILTIVIYVLMMLFTLLTYVVIKYMGG